MSSRCAPFALSFKPRPLRAVAAMRSASADVADSSTMTTFIVEDKPLERAASARFSANLRANTCILTGARPRGLGFRARVLSPPRSPSPTVPPSASLAFLTAAHVVRFPASPPTNAPLGTRSKSPPASTRRHSLHARSSNVPPCFIEYDPSRALSASAPMSSAMSSASKYRSERSETSTTAP